MKFARRNVLHTLALAALAITLGGSARAENKLTLGFAQVGAESEWRTANTASIKDAAA